MLAINASYDFQFEIKKKNDLNWSTTELKYEM